MEVAEDVRVDWGGSSVLFPRRQGGVRIKDYLPNVLGDEGRGSLQSSTCLPLGKKANHLEGCFLPPTYHRNPFLSARLQNHSP